MKNYQSTIMQILCILAGYSIARLQPNTTQQNIPNKLNQVLLPIKAHHIPNEEKNNFNQGDRVILTKSENLQPWCYIPEGSGTLISVYPTWVSVKPNNIKTWDHMFKKDRMIIPIRFKKNLPPCRTKKPRVKWID